MKKVKNDMSADRLTRWGFKFNRGGAHTARTMMLEELTRLLDYIPQPDAQRQDYAHAVVRDNCLGKRSGQNRLLTLEHLIALYGLDPGMVIFRALRYYWMKDVGSRPIIALLCAYARDPLLRLTASFILRHKEGDRIPREKTEAFIESQKPNCYSGSTLMSLARNINSTWTKTGHLAGITQKIRCRAAAGPGAAAYALFLAHLTGARGPGLFETEYLEILDTSRERAVELAELAARRGWMVFKHIGEVIEVTFPHLLTKKETERPDE